MKSNLLKALKKIMSSYLTFTLLIYACGLAQTPDTLWIEDWEGN